jgi:predicted amidohydrolase
VVRICLIQLDVDLSEPLSERVVRVAGLVRAQRGADLVVLPELWPQGGFAYDRWAAEAEPLDGPTAAAMAAAARDLAGHLHAGSLLERGTDGALYNCSMLFGPDGDLLRTYRKIHLFGFAEGEAELLTAGEEIVTCPTPLGTLGLATCYDLRFPEQFRLLLDAGTEILLVPAAWPDRRVEHWRLLARARAVESQVYVLACNTAGEQNGVRLGGHSLAVDPWGTVLAEAAAGEEILVADIDPELVAKTREQFPVLRDRRLG